MVLGIGDRGGQCSGSLPSGRFHKPTRTEPTLWRHGSGEWKKLIKCIHEVCARCMAKPHSVTGIEVTELRWTGGEGTGSAMSLLNATYIQLRCIVTWHSPFTDGLCVTNCCILYKANL